MTISAARAEQERKLRELLTSTQEAKMRKMIDFKNLVGAIQAYADKHCEGNFNMAVRQLVKKGLVVE